MNTVVTAILSIALSVAAQFFLKTGMSCVGVKEVMAQPLAFRTIFTIFSNKFVLGGFVLYGLGAVAWLAVLSRWDVSKAYPLVGFGFALTVVIGALLGEEVTALRIAGMVLICLGVLLVARS